MEKFKELEKMLEGLILSQKKTDEQFRRTDEQLRRTDEQLRRTDGRLRLTEEYLRETGRQIRESQRKTDEQIGELQKAQRKTDEKLKSIGDQLASIGFNNGDFAEELFFRGLENNPILGGIRYDTVERKVIPPGDAQAEYDILLLNGSHVAIIEVKYKAHPSEIKKLAKTKTGSFRGNFNVYKNHVLHFGVASLVTNPSLIKRAKEEGIFLLTQKGDHLEVVNSEVKAF